MAKREVTVVINGEEYVSKAAEQAAKGMDGFTGKVGGWFKSFVDLKAAWDLAVRAAGALWAQVTRSLDAFDEYRASLQKIDGTAKITGIPLRILQEIATEGRDKFKLSTVAANDFAAGIANLAQRAGKTDKAKDALKALLDIGAARGLTAAQSLEALNSALAGNDEGTDRLFGKNPSQLWKEYAAQIGVSAGKMTDAQKWQALLNEVMEAGVKTNGVYALYLDTTAGKQEQLNNAIINAQIAFGAALDPLRLIVLETGAKLMPALAELAPFVAQVVTLAFTGFAKALNYVYGISGIVAGALGRIAGKVEWQVWGLEAATNATRVGNALDNLSNAALKLTESTKKNVEEQAKLDRKYEESSSQIEKHKDKTAAAQSAIRAASTASADQLTADAERINRLITTKLGPPLKDAIGLTEGALTSLGVSARQQLDASVADEFTRNMGHLRDRAAEVRARIEGLPAPVKKASDSTKDMAEDVADIARAGIDAAQAFGVMNDEAASTLNSVINLGVSIAKVAGGDMSSIPGIIASAANIISKMIGGDPERRRLIAANTDAMRQLRDRIGDLGLDVTGEDFGRIQTALQSVVGNLRGGRGAQNQADVINALRRQGLGFGDLKKLAEQLGIQITSSSGALSVDGIKALLEAMGLVELGQFGTDYGAQLQQTRARFDVDQLDARGQLAALFGLGGKFAFGSLGNALNINDLAGSRANLKALFDRMNAGGLSAGELGGLTGVQFLELITDLIQRIDDLAKETADAGAGTTVDVPGVGAVSTGGAAGTVQEKIAEQTASVTDLLKTHTALHTRIAEATERTADGVERIEQLLVEASRGGLSDAVDTQLESSRRALAAQQGAAAAF